MTFYYKYTSFKKIPLNLKNFKFKFQIKKDVQIESSGSFIDNRYKRLDLIGEGSEAYVYRVEDLEVSRDSPFRMYILNFKHIALKERLLPLLKDKN